MNLYSKSYINHLLNTNEILGSMLLTLNNISFYQQLMEKIRESIKTNSFDVFYKKFVNVIQFWLLYLLEINLKEYSNTHFRAVSSVGRAIPF